MRVPVLCARCSTVALPGIAAKPSARLPTLLAPASPRPMPPPHCLQLTSNRAMCDRVLSADGIEQPLAALHSALTLVQ